ncbi:hypothetical protein [Nocardioides humi]|uniref:hypothetical protein n=1 Tax=Nocardioides humi TaxID=449461 RepID=UPI001FE32A9E|nr:hypothetical protein [Nocardioides humi]
MEHLDGGLVRADPEPDHGPSLAVGRREPCRGEGVDGVGLGLLGVLEAEGVGGVAEVGERRPAERAVDGPEEERGVLLVDEHRQPEVGGTRAAGWPIPRRWSRR